jgi:hypothetical protein
MSRDLGRSKPLQAEGDRGELGRIGPALTAVVALLTGLVSLTVLAVRLWDRPRYKRCFTDADDAMPGTFLSVTRRHLVITVELATPGEWGPKELSEGLLRGQKIHVFASGEKVGVQGRTGTVVLSSGRWERILLGRGRRRPEHLHSYGYRDPLTGCSKADQIGEADGGAPREDVIGSDAPDDRFHRGSPITVRCPTHEGGSRRSLLRRCARRTEEWALTPPSRHGKRRAMIDAPLERITILTGGQGKRFSAAKVQPIWKV